MGLQLYGHPRTTCTLRVLTIAKEKGIHINLNVVDTFGGQHLTEEYMQNFHPFKRVPVLCDDETNVKVFESRAIAQYIAAKHRKNGIDLAPSTLDLATYARYQQALSIEAAYFEPAVYTILNEHIFKVRKGLGLTDEALVKKKLEELDNALQGYQIILSKQAYLAGDQISCADLFHLPHGVLLEPFGFTDLLIKYPAVEKWWNGLKSRPSWKEVSAGPSD